MNVFKKYCPNVWVAQCDEKHNKGEVIVLETQYGKKVECEVYNLLAEKNDKFYYSIVRLEESYATRKAEKYRNSQAVHAKKSFEWYQKSQEGAEFLRLGEPIKVGHHSEHRHRALIERNWNRMGSSVKEQEIADERARKAEYWEAKAEEINLSMPESLEYFTAQLEKAKARQKGLKDGTIEREHSYSLTYATKAVKELAQKVELAQKLWG
ncbi:DUF3560 domain-containing protein [uncultured Campylobacter sp.]|uniref:DUF3560 domain-containing protein n=1 Tax=uncultured Campylobacter sp. TaxID=218934 RepID=UPI002618B6E9|nr:DUF3560 domain-containing protein [uncultured Campylobacter sp.]